MGGSTGEGVDAAEGDNYKRVRIKPTFNTFLCLNFLVCLFKVVLVTTPTEI